MIIEKDESFGDWCARNEQELTEIFAESGADRECDFNREREELKLYDSSYFKLKPETKNSITFKDKEICDCECHVKGTIIMHCFPCCELCYEKYINEDGTIDAKTYAELNKKD